jgi:hypothetical protein
VHQGNFSLPRNNAANLKELMLVCQQFYQKKQVEKNPTTNRAARLIMKNFYIS